MVTCVGNEVGCKDGDVWLQDPRCHPYCPGTVIKKGYDTTAMRMLGGIILVLVLTLVLILYVRSDLILDYVTNPAYSGGEVTSSGRTISLMQ